ncbi:hypothetical protein Daura_05685 [Dactylosporangium aurantiacum]|uniref:Right handed beta helix domain-containing protein n=1 Tax=Dactylosporangium aurantiacum TaxID=35754 RepID=A0A9Q9IMI0_9ACTN|nr:hypothetical protein [Dactylosporangium aurantiacum]MDG6104741.1 hypothetical protein [Dactylosporangium aurantiacum]UWZ55693.1 hypothetical protein Daura_05685 [Dactylosporangium aurantiacum]
MNTHHNSPTTVTRSALRRTSVGIVAAALFAGGALSACKDLPATGSAGRPTTSPVAGTPSTSTSVAPVSSTSPSAASPSPSKSASTSPKPPAPGGGGGGGVPPTYTVAGFPAANNTGYPQGLPGDTRKKVTLTPYTGPMTITVAGTVIDGKDINGHLEIKAKNVTIRNSRIRVANVQAVTSTDDNANLRIEDTEIDGQLKDASTGGIALIGRTGFTLLRVNAHGSGDILRIDGRGTVQDSWLHDPGGTGSAQHNDVIQSTNASYIRILHNRLENQHTQTSCILLKADIGSISDVVVDSNLMNGGGYSFYWYDANYKITNGKVTNNRFMRQSGGGFWPKGGYYGTQAFQASQLPTWSNNTWNDNGQQIKM